ncbi:hypothetical protein HFO61_07890 [Rhizobium leguminosarum]|uniref:hypothetical protein n=1 Tax=Rhizobium leguminosarum TaxID=384 RepID=UPI001C93B2A9|nr:hypothetical protein [Rhizobium leguminosarum]MBY5546750.1 hypothetical protein [Rhizobium leguminosarum]
MAAHTRSNRFRRRDHRRLFANRLNELRLSKAKQLELTLNRLILAHEARKKTLVETKT